MRLPYLKYFFFVIEASLRSIGWDWLKDIRPVDAWAEVASSADVAVWVMDEVIWLPSSWDQVLFGFNRGLLHGIDRDTFNGADGNEGKELKHV